MTLPVWWQVAKPHKDIITGQLSEAIFAADLGNVFSGTAPPEYQDAVTFFEKTYLTKGLKDLLENVFSCLAGTGGDPVIQLQTPFGGGKTHALLALYHAIKHRDEVGQISAVSELPSVENAKVAVFIGTYADAVTGKTPWGEIAEQLGQYEIVKEHDKKRIAPGKERLAEVLEASGPTLILIDEFLEYIVKADRAEKVEKVTHGQTIGFLQELSEVVASSRNCCLVVTLPTSTLERYDVEAETTWRQLQHTIGRVETIYAPVEGMEVYEVIRKRLFEDIGDENTRKQVSKSFFDLYHRLSTDVPSEVKEAAYRERMQRAYPFHPELIDTLYERWGSFSTFQRTRGVLRLLAEVVADLYNRKVVSPLIQSSLVNLGNQKIKSEFIKHIGPEFDSIISADIAGKHAKAPSLDREIGSEFERYCIAEGVATSIFLYSFNTGVSKVTTLPRIRVSLLREGIPPTIVGDATAKLAEELWYLHSEKNEYAFSSEPNLNRVIVDREETISDDRIQNEIKEITQANSGRALEMYLWPQSTSDIPDNKNLKLAVLPPSLSYDSDKSKLFVEKLFENAGEGFRVYRNTLFALLMDDSQLAALRMYARRLLALTDIQTDTSLRRRLREESLEDLKKRLTDAEKEAPFRILSAYRHLGTQKTGITWNDLGMPTVGSDRVLSERVRQFLRDEEKLLTRLTPKYLVENAFAEGEDEKPLRQIYELHLKTPGMPIPDNEGVLIQAVAEGVKSGALGVREDSQVYYKETVTPHLDSVVLRGDVAQREKLHQEDGEKIPSLADVAIRLERTACYGPPCPIYRVTITGNGRVEYEGTAYVEVTGKQTGSVSEEEIRQLVSEFMEIRYFSLEDSYVNKIVPDKASAITCITVDGKKTKEIRHYLGDTSAPEELTELEKRIDDIAKTDRWVKPTGQALITRVTLRAKIPWDKISSIVTGVIAPLKEGSFPPEITIEIKAESKEGFDRNTLDSQVKETLQQIGAEIEEWLEE